MRFVGTSLVMDSKKKLYKYWYEFSRVIMQNYQIKFLLNKWSLNMIQKSKIFNYLSCIHFKIYSTKKENSIRHFGDRKAQKRAAIK